MKHLFVGLPCYSGQIWVSTMMGLFYGLWALDGWRVELYPVLFNADLSNTRSVLVAKFWRSEATDLVMIDNDLMFDAETLPRLLSHDVDVVGCDYPRRMEPITYSSRLMKVNGGWHAEIDDNGLMLVETVPTGLLRISRRAIGKLIEKYPELTFDDPDAPGNNAYALFEKVIIDSKQWSEDNSFCWRWNQIGGRIYLDTAISVAHWGSKPFSGNYSEWLQRAKQLPVE
jgi:hypothetical protein